MAPPATCLLVQTEAWRPPLGFLPRALGPLQPPTAELVSVPTCGPQRQAFSGKVSCIQTRRGGVLREGIKLATVRSHRAVCPPTAALPDPPALFPPAGGAGRQRGLSRRRGDVGTGRCPRRPGVFREGAPMQAVERWRFSCSLTSAIRGEPREPGGRRPVQGGQRPALVFPACVCLRRAPPGTSPPQR